jgi:hypothetical protein
MVTEYAYVYHSVPAGGSPISIPPGTDIPFPNTGPILGIGRASSTTFILPSIGIYEIVYHVTID